MFGELHPSQFNPQGNPSDTTKLIPTVLELDGSPDIGAHARNNPCNLSCSDSGYCTAQTTVLVLGGNSDIGVHVRSHFCYLICSKAFD